MRFAPLMFAAVLGCAAHPPVVSRPSFAPMFWKDMRAGDFVGAAALAHDAKLDPWYVGQAFSFAKRKAFGLAPDDEAGLLSTDHGAPVGRYALTQEIDVACRYGPYRATARLAVKDAFSAWHASPNDDMLLVEAAEAGCPFEGGEVDDVIGAARVRKRYDLIKDVAVRASIGEADKKRIAGDVAWTMDCLDGVELGLELGLSDASLENVAGRCGIDHGPHDITWHFRDHDQANALFFAAVRQGRLMLAFALVPVAEPGYESEANDYVCQEAFRGTRDFHLDKSFPHLPTPTKETALTWLMAHGKYRMAGWLTDDQKWEHKAFDAAIAAGKYEDAGEIAQYGVELTFRKTGPLEAFRAAMHAKDFATGRALKYRYAISDDEYWKAYNEAFPATTPAAPANAPRRKRPSKPPCKDTGDWEVQPCPK